MHGLQNHEETQRLSTVSIIIQLSTNTPLSSEARRSSGRDLRCPHIETVSLPTVLIDN